MAPDKFKRALRSAARFPVRSLSRTGPGTGTGTGTFTPLPNEHPLVLLRIQVLGCTSLLGKDRSGHSDPFVVVSLLSTRFQTPVVKKTLNPTYAPREATFEVPIYLSVADRLGAVELVVWDKDMLGKEYLGEAAVRLEEWWGGEEGGRAFGWEEEGNKAFTVGLQSTKAGTAVSGQVHVKFGFVRPAQSQTQLEFDEIFSELVKRSRPSLVSAPPTEGVGTIRSHQGAIEFEDDGGISSSDEGESDDDDDDQFVDALEGDNSANLSDLYIPPSKPQQQPPPPQLTVQPSSPIADYNDSKTPTASIAAVLTTPTQSQSPVIHAPKPSSKPPGSPSFAKKIFPMNIPLPRRLSGLTSSRSSSPSNANLPPPLPDVPPPSGSLDPVSGTLAPGTPASAPDDGLVTPLPTVEGGKKSPGGRNLFRKGAKTPLGSAPPTPGAEEQLVIPPQPGAGKRTRMGKGKAYSLDAGNDILGIVMLEVIRAEDLPKLKNMTRTGWDMDPFVVVSFGKKVFRTRVVRHSLNPTFEEKLLFHVRRYETSFSVQLAVHDWDKLSSNDHIGDARFEVKTLIDQAPQKDAETGLYGGKEYGEHDMVEMKLKLDSSGPGLTTAAALWDPKHTPAISIRAKYQPYDLLRQRFWRTYLKQYDTDDTSTISHLELTSMLDSLGSTLTRPTVDSFFTKLGKKPHRDELSIEEAVGALEGELGRPEGEKRRVGEEGEEGGSSVSLTPAVGEEGGKLDLEGMDFSGPAHAGGEGYVTQGAEVSLVEAAAGPGPGQVVVGTPGSYTSSASYSSDDAEEVGVVSPAAAATVPAGKKKGIAARVKKTRFRKKNKVPKEASTGSNHSGSLSGSGSGSGSGSSSDDPLERVINVKNCPLCHRPRLNSKAEVDIITHLAVCASQDWGKIDRIVVGNFVTASQAQRKWYTRIIGKVSGGDYRLGANSANIIVQDRRTGRLEEEKMQVYVRLGIRLLYKGATSRMEGGRARRLLKSLSFKQGVKYDSPQSAVDIPGFIEFHGLNMDEILDPLESFKTFNQFFYRKLKPSARPIESPTDPYRLVSAADCRLMAFSSVDEATRLWIKGREFTVRRLLGEAYAGEAERYVGGALAIFRLAPQDYHRFHSPVEGRVGRMVVVDGEYYTVNPQAIRSSLDVYGENVRKIVPIDSVQFGRVMAVCIGAMMVGSIKTTVQEGEYVHRGQEFGYFAFGGSTIVLLFEKDRVVWDEDLLVNGRASLETLVRVGMGIGRRPGVGVD